MYCKVLIVLEVQLVMMIHVPNLKDLKVPTITIIVEPKVQHNLGNIVLQSTTLSTDCNNLQSPNWK